MNPDRFSYCPLLPILIFYSLISWNLLALRKAKSRKILLAFHNDGTRVYLSEDPVIPSQKLRLFRDLGLAETSYLDHLNAGADHWRPLLDFAWSFFVWISLDQRNTKLLFATYLMSVWGSCASSWDHMDVLSRGGCTPAWIGLIRNATGCA